MTAHFWNLNEDPQLTNMVAHFLQPGIFLFSSILLKPMFNILHIVNILIKIAQSYLSQSFCTYTMHRSKKKSKIKTANLYPSDTAMFMMVISSS